MLYLIYGENMFEARRKVREITANLLSRDSNASVNRLTEENSNEEKLSGLISGQNLFGSKSVNILDELLKSDLSGEVLKGLPQMSESKDVFIILEEKPDTKAVGKISKFAQKTETFKEIKEKNPKKPAHNPFALGDLLVSRKRREAYKLFHKNLAEGVSAEEMFWKLWWQVKTLVSVSSLKEAGQNISQIKTNTGLHPFVVQKSLSALSLFKRAEIERIWDDLFVLWRDGRSDGTALSCGIERILLGL